MGRGLSVCVWWLVALSAWPGVAYSQKSTFVSVDGAQFSVDGAPFRFVGANASVIHGGNERRDYEAVLDAMAADGLKVARIWALGEQTLPAKPYHPLYAFRIGPDGWVDASFVQLDRVLAAAKARGLRAIIVLANRWKDYGGIATYTEWAGQAVTRDSNGDILGTQLRAFYDCAACQVRYREHVTRVVGRVNSVSGVAYRDDPTIMAWELINEASAVSAADKDALLTWVQAQARFVRSLDARHLISAGHIGYHTGHERAVWTSLQALPEIDFADAHAYPLGDPRIKSPERLARWIDDTVGIATRLHKPLVFGEFGFSHPLLHERERWVRRFLRHAARRGVAGSLIWHYEPAANPRRAHSISQDGKDAASLRIRRAMTEAAAWFAAPAPAPFDGPAFAYTETLRGARGPAPRWQPAGEGQQLDIDPLTFVRAEFERAGVYRRGALDVVYGTGAGFIEYRFDAPRVALSAVIIRARMSSELPGYGQGLDARDGSDVELQLDGEVIGTVRARPDDGLGEVNRIAWVDARSLQRFATRLTHRLRFDALPSGHAGGLCLYGKPTGSVAMEAAWQREVDQIRIELVPPREPAQRPELRVRSPLAGSQRPFDRD